MDLEVISTTGVAPKDRLTYWNENAGQKIAPVVARQLGETTFNASLRCKSARDFTLMHMRATPAFVRTEPAHFDTGMINLTLLKRGKVLSRTGGIATELEHLDLVLYDPDQPIEVTYLDGMDMLILRLPVVDLERHFPRLRQLTGRRLNGSRGGGAMLAHFLIELWDQYSSEKDDELLDSMGAVIWPLLEAAYANELRSVAIADCRSAERRTAMVRVIQDKLCDPELNTEMLAEFFHMTPRSVQLVFAQLGTTPTQYIRNRRLDLAAKMLTAGPAMRNVTDVCYDVGFGDLSTFCRSFKNRFGVAPSRYRTGPRGSSGPEARRAG